VLVQKYGTPPPKVGEELAGQATSQLTYSGCPTARSTAKHLNDFTKHPKCNQILPRI
jgi:hypothetical protein